MTAQSRRALIVNQIESSSFAGSSHEEFVPKTLPFGRSCQAHFFNFPTRCRTARLRAPVPRCRFHQAFDMPSISRHILSTLTKLARYADTP
jgi:hypothetical protein